MKPCRVLRDLTIGERRQLPGGIFGIEGAANIDRIHTEAVEDDILGLGELLDDVIDARVPLDQAEVFFEIAVSDGRDTRAGRGPEVNRHFIQLTMLDGGEDTFAGGHNLW